MTTPNGADRSAAELLAGSSYLSSEDPRAHFGLGEPDADVSVIVRWPDGTERTAAHATVDQTLVISRSS